MFLLSTFDFVIFFSTSLYFYVFLSQTVELVALHLDACFGEALPVCVCPRMLLLDVKDSLQDRAWVLKRSNL